MCMLSSVQQSKKIARARQSVIGTMRGIKNARFKWKEETALSDEASVELVEFALRASIWQRIISGIDFYMLSTEQVPLLTTPLVPMYFHCLDTQAIWLKITAEFLFLYGQGVPQLCIPLVLWSTWGEVRKSVGHVPWFQLLVSEEMHETHCGSSILMGVSGEMLKALVCLW